MGQCMGGAWLHGDVVMMLDLSIGGGLDNDEEVVVCVVSGCEMEKIFQI